MPTRGICEDEECFDAPDAASMEDAISEFVEGMESQECSKFDDIHRLVKGLPVPVTKAIRLMTHAEAIDAQFLPNMVGMSVEKTLKCTSVCMCCVCWHSNIRKKTQVRKIDGGSMRMHPTTSRHIRKIDGGSMRMHPTTTRHIPTYTVI